MTPAELIAARMAVGWPRTQLARMLDCDEKTIRQMETAERSIPPSVAQWLGKLARWHAEHPPPSDWRVRE